jgi:hypothetical protein
MIYTIGDSHSQFTFHDIPEVKAFWLGPMTMHRVGRDSLNFKQHGVPTDRSVMACFGEIDARCHVQKQSLATGQSIDAVISDLLSRYINALLVNANEYKIIVMGIVPPAYFERADNNADFPFTGTNSERAVITKKMNIVLEELCKVHNLKFIDIYSLYADASGMLPPELGDECDGKGVHIKITDRIKECLKNNNLI